MDTIKAELNAFLERINHLVRDSFGSFGSGNVYQPTMTMQRQTGLNLQNKALEFAQALLNRSTNRETVDRLAQELEGLILAGNSIGVMTSQETDQLIDELYNIKEKR